MVTEEEVIGLRIKGRIGHALADLQVEGAVWKGPEGSLLELRATSC